MQTLINLDHRLQKQNKPRERQDHLNATQQNTVNNYSKKMLNGVFSVISVTLRTPDTAHSHAPVKSRKNFPGQTKNSREYINQNGKLPCGQTHSARQRDNELRNGKQVANLQHELQKQDVTMFYI